MNKRTQKTCPENLLRKLDDLENPADFEPTGTDRSIYLDLMEHALDGWRRGQTAGADTEKDGLQVRSRVLSCLGGLIAAGRKRGELGMWEDLMDRTCGDLPKRGDNGYAGPETDFAVKELMLALRAMRPRVPPEKCAGWKNKLGQIEPERHYASVLGRVSGKEALHNINIYNMTGEYLREAEGLTDSADYFARHWPTQLERFDENGMYRDPGSPMLYDLTVRAHIGLLLGSGYGGEFREALDRNIRQGGLMSLFMQSAAGQVPYGGRSSQFNFNEALHAAVCEYEAVRYAKLGNLKAAGAFKRSAKLAVRSILRWVRPEGGGLPRHLKNNYDPLSEYGAEPYGHYAKYIVSLGSFAYMAWLAADDGIEESVCPAEAGGYVLRTSDSFHAVFANAAGRSIQIDLCGSAGYDATGLGRYHRAGRPAELALSAPFAANAAYHLPGKAGSSDACIGPGWMTPDGKLVFLAELRDDGLESEVEFERAEASEVVLRIGYSGPALTQKGIFGIEEKHTLSKRGLEIACRIVTIGCRANGAKPEAYYRVPLLAENGGDYTVCEVVAPKTDEEPERQKAQERECETKRGNDYTLARLADVRLGKNVYRVSANAVPVGQSESANRNGVYTLFTLRAAGEEIALELDMDTFGAQ
ncbi:hypothetical protein [Saccharibacillus sacchari]|uniref:Uncharacterized protein n=1 Tax=Saccharibacillus sacchari TaxID=456493 RepID=A0ACC6PDP6_9BACL